MSNVRILYECGICSCYHPWGFDGDCRDDNNRYGAPEDYEAKYSLGIGTCQVRSWEERVQADAEEHPEVAAKLQSLLG